MNGSGEREWSGRYLNVTSMSLRVRLNQEDGEQWEENRI